MGRYDEVYRRSLEDPAAFWSEAAAALRWQKKWDRVFDPANPKQPRWFQGGELNTCENAIDVHVETGRALQHEQDEFLARRNASFGQPDYDLRKAMKERLDHLLAIERY